MESGDGGSAMSSRYRIICLSHDPAIVVLEPDWPQPDDPLRVLADRASLPEHANCELVVGRFSYPLVQVCCPQSMERSNGPLHIGYHPHSDEWIDAGWLRLLLAAGPDAAKRARVPGCWSYERANRLRLELDLGDSS